MPSHSQSQLSSTTVRSILAVVLVSMNLQGCALLAWNALKPIEIQKKAQPRTPLNLPEPRSLKPTAPEWIVITPENSAAVFQKLQQQNRDQVLFAITDDGYEALAVDTAEIRNFIQQQRVIIQKYKDYYESTPQQKP